MCRAVLEWACLAWMENLEIRVISARPGCRASPGPLVPLGPRVRPARRDSRGIREIRAISAHRVSRARPVRLVLPGLRAHWVQ